MYHPFPVSTVNVLLFPVIPSFDFAFTAAGECVLVRPAITLALFDESFVGEGVEIRVESAVVDFFLVSVS